jgi:hypothetical protein
MTPVVGMGIAWHHAIIHAGEPSDTTAGQGEMFNTRQEMACTFAKKSPLPILGNVHSAG